MIRSALLLLLLTTPAVATPACPDRSDAMTHGIRITYDDETDIDFTVSKDGTVTERILADDTWWYESIGNVFLLRYGNEVNGATDPALIDTAHYEIPLNELPTVDKNLNWKGHVSYTREGKPPWETDMTVSSSPYPDLQLGECTYEASLITIIETAEDGPYVSYLVYLTELGFGIRIGSFVQNEQTKTVPVSIGLINKE